MTVKLLLGDQLNLQHSWFEKVDESVVFVMFEMRQETDYVSHHIQKVIAFFGAMRSFCETLRTKGHQVHYFTLDDSRNTQTLEGNLDFLLNHYSARSFAYLEPDEYRLDLQLKKYCKTLSIPYTVFDTEHFMTSRNELSEFFKGKKQLILEYFYRSMRKKFNLLMEFDQPEGGQWNFDKSNRKKWKGSPPIPPAFLPKSKNLLQIKQMVAQCEVPTIGFFNLNAFFYPLNREEALNQLDYFCTHLLKHFGDYQDALHTDEVNLFHSRISFALNTKMIHPLEVVQTVIEYYKSQQQDIELSQVEGFVRQIIGWREFMRGIYWKEMPDYEFKNVLQNTNSLPKFYWTGKTKMNCLHQSITNSLEHAYAHHIQRLMITGNFALLINAHPDAVDEWYLGIYADAIQWVQITNTRGMSQWADGGIVATKPYVSAAAYIHKMSNYCDSCVYDNKKRIGENACPFNSLYWNFLDDKKQFFEKNNRMAMMLRLLQKIAPEDLEQIKLRAAKIIENPDEF
jgi:deoxyribodipyrimidine photolyase-related protein